MTTPIRPTGIRSALLSGILCIAALLNASCASAITPIYEHKEGALPSIRFMLPGEIPLELVTLPAGSIAMEVNRKPQPNETADKDGRVVYKFGENELSVGKFEVTQAQWQAVMRTTQKQLSEAARPGGKAFGIGPDLPVYDVSADQAKEFCARLNKSLPGSFRYRFTLPDEAEWEYACRAGTTTELNSGRDLRARNNVSNALSEVAWYRGNSFISAPSVSEKGLKAPNAWGLYDMHGNVQELCLDWFMRDFSAAYMGDLCAMRGGSWHCSPEDRVRRRIPPRAETRREHPENAAAVRADAAPPGRHHRARRAREVPGRSAGRDHPEGESGVFPERKELPRIRQFLLDPRFICLDIRDRLYQKGFDEVPHIG